MADGSNNKTPPYAYQRDVTVLVPFDTGGGKMTVPTQNQQWDKMLCA